MKKVLCALFLTITTIQSNVFFEKPMVIDPAQVAEIAAQWETYFTWGLGNGCNLILTYHKGKAGFLIQALYVPIRSSNFPYYATLKSIIDGYRKPQKQGGYYMAEPLKIAQTTPASLNSEELCSYLQNRAFIFYTGAGISASGKVATMNDLQQSLKIDWNNRCLYKQPFLKEAFLNPQTLTNAFDQFCKSAIEGEPTLAHKAVHEITQHRSMAIITENVDLLHHRAGSATMQPRPGMCDPDDIKAVSVIVCVGLSHDDRGFLSYFKEHNPEGVIIAIDKCNPDYLSINDYIVQEDLQTVLPTLAEYLIGKNTNACS